MSINKYKTLLPMLILSFVVLSFANSTYAYECTDLTAGGAPDPTSMLCVFNKGINLALQLAGVVFAIMLGIGAIKLAVALGDPKGLQGASKTWSFAFIGFFLIAASVSLFFIVGKIFGVGEMFKVDKLLGGSEEGFEAFKGLLNIGTK